MMKEESVSEPRQPQVGPLRVLMLAEPYVPTIGGLERHVHALSSELVRRGHRVSVATTTHAGSPSFEIREGVRVHRMSGLSRALEPFYETERRFHPTVPDPGVVISLSRLVASERPQIVHAHSWMMYSFLPLKEWSGARLVVTLHDYSLICPKKTYLHGGEICAGPAYAKCLRCASLHYGAVKAVALTTGLRMSRRLHDRVDRYIAASDAVGRALADAGRLPGTVEVVPSFIPDDSAALGVRARRPAFLPPADDYLLFVGALGWHKGLDVLLEAWSSLSPRPPLVLIGTTREDTPSRFPPGVTAVYDAAHEMVMAAWSHCVAGVIPSRSEGAPTVAIEAMAAGRPVVASAVGGVPELVTHDETGLLVPPGDAAALRDAIQSLLADPARRARMGEAGRRRARRFTVSDATDRIEQLYAETLERPGSGADGARADAPAGGQR
jgi:glycosyltransferase involved in cell wall biosynthesis